MASHFSDIGLRVKSQEDFNDLARQVVPKAEVFKVPGGSYLRWAGRGGEELWLQLDARNVVIGMNPHFAGPSSVRIRLGSRIHRANDTPLDGAIDGWVNPGDEAESGDYPIVLDLPDSETHAELLLPAVADVQVAAFAHEATIFGSQDAYESSQEGAVKFASRSFIPSGMFKPGGEATEPPSAYAIFTGHVMEAEEKRNDLTGASYYWALVDTYGGRYDVVMDPELVPAPPVAGGVLSGTFWLSARIKREPQRKAGLLGRFTKRGLQA